MLKRAALYDPACSDLAEHFLSDEPFTRDTMAEHVERVRGLSCALQSAAEEWLEDNPLPAASREDQTRHE